MKFITLLLIICFLVIPLLVSAANNTTENITVNTTVNITPTLNITIVQSPTQIITLLPEEFYGNVIYSDGSPVSSGSQITAMDQRGKTIGNFTMTFNGSYGESYASASRLIVYAEHTDDQITFYIDNVKSSTPPRKFDSAAIKRSDITMPASAKPTPTPTLTLEPTPEPTVEVTTSIPTPEPTVIVTTIAPTPIPTLIPTPKPAINDTTIKFAGVLLIAIAICVVGAIITYYILTKKMKRDDEEEIIL